MADRKISDLTALTTPASGDYLPIVDISEVAAASKNKRITIEELFRGVPLGTAAAPSIAIEGDENTGIYSPGADQLAISTNGTGRLFINASGNVGLGAANPVSNTGYGGLTMNGSNGAILSMSQAGTETFRVTNATGYTFINTVGATPLLFGTAANENMRLDLSGRLGLGTTSPSARLHVSGGDSVFGSTNIFRILSSGQVCDFSNAAQDAYVAGRINGLNLKFYTNTGSGIDIDSSGRVGIGTTAPGSPLNIVSSSDATIILTRTAAANAKITTTSNGALAFGLDSSGGNTERARIDSSGRLLVGTSSVLNSNGLNGLINVTTNNTALRAATYAFFDNNALGTYLTLAKSRSSTIGTYTYPNSGDLLGSLDFAGANTADSRFNSGCAIAGYANQTWTSTAQGSYLVFSTTADGASSPTERMRITNIGNVAIGSTDYTSARLSIGGYTDGTRYGLYMRPSADNATPLAFFNAANTSVGSITTSSSATAYNTSSDYRLKENIEPVTESIARLKQLKPCRFNFIAAPENTVDGFLAHEAAEVVPECATGEKDAVDAEGNPVYQGIDQSKLVPLLTAALQEAIAKIETLEAKVAALESA